jgi:hypothetical protein
VFVFVCPAGVRCLYQRDVTAICATGRMTATQSLSCCGCEWDDLSLFTDNIAIGDTGILTSEDISC